MSDFVTDFNHKILTETLAELSGSRSNLECLLTAVFCSCYRFSIGFWTWSFRMIQSKSRIQLKIYIKTEKNGLSTDMLSTIYFETNRSAVALAVRCLRSLGMFPGSELPCFLIGPSQCRVSPPHWAGQTMYLEINRFSRSARLLVVI